MKIKPIFTVFILCFSLVSCANLKPASVVKNGEIKDYKYIYISQTKSLTSSTGASIDGQYYSTSKSVNPRDVITGILAKEGYILIPDLQEKLSNETLIANYGESGRRNTGLGRYTIEVTIQFVSSTSNSLVCSCTAEGQGSTEADDIREAITRCLNSIISDQTE